jgi:hypothetical protein
MTIKIEDKYYNYDNVSLIDFVIRAPKFPDGIIDKSKRYYCISVSYNGWGAENFIFDSEEEWVEAKSKFEQAVINNVPYVELKESKDIND